jgi:hypothetical protein
LKSGAVAGVELAVVSLADSVVEAVDAEDSLALSSLLPKLKIDVEAVEAGFAPKLNGDAVGAGLAEKRGVLEFCDLENKLSAFSASDCSVAVSFSACVGSFDVLATFSNSGLEISNNGRADVG